MHRSTAPGLVLHLFLFVILCATRTALGTETITANHGTLLNSQRELHPSQVGAISLRLFSLETRLDSAAGDGSNNLRSIAPQLVTSLTENRNTVIPSLTAPPDPSDFQIMLDAIETFESEGAIVVAPVPEASTWLAAALAALLVLLKLPKRGRALRHSSDCLM